MIKQKTQFKTKESGLYGIIISAECNAGDELAIKIDNLEFREQPPYKYTQRFTHAAAWHGNTLRGQEQTNIYLIELQEGIHTLEFIAKGDPNIISWGTKYFSDPENINLVLDKIADDYERKPFVNTIAINLPIMSITGTMGLQWRLKNGVRGDGDDVKLVIDGVAYTDNNSQWLWQAKKTDIHKQVLSTKKVTPNLDSGLHYIQFIADRSPLIQRINLNVVLSHKGDYRIHATTIHPDNIKERIKSVFGYLGNQGTQKPVLGVYFPDEAPDINNDNIELYFKGQRLTTGDHKNSKASDEVFDFNSPLRQSQADKHWFYYGIDNSWRLKPENADWCDDENWKIIKL